MTGGHEFAWVTDPRGVCGPRPWHATRAPTRIMRFISQFLPQICAFMLKWLCRIDSSLNWCQGIETNELYVCQRLPCHFSANRLTKGMRRGSPPYKTAYEKPRELPSGCRLGCVFARVDGAPNSTYTTTTTRRHSLYYSSMDINITRGLLRRCLSYRRAAVHNYAFLHCCLNRNTH